MPETKDQMIRAIIGGGGISAFAIRSTAMANAARNIHDLFPTALAAMGRLMSITAIMGWQIKTDNGSITISFNGDGPMGKLIAVGKPDGKVKAAIENPHVDLPIRESDGKLDVGGAVGHGRLSVVKDLGFGEPYVGQVNIQTGEISEDMAFYLTASEQSPSLVALGVLVDRDGTALSSGGIVFQVLPDCSEELIEKLEARIENMSQISRLFQGDTPVAQILQEVLGDIEMEVLEEIEPEYFCDCTRERVERTILSLGADEIRDIIKEQGHAQVVCHFCNSAYEFDARELGALLAEAKSEKQNTTDE